MDEVQPRDPSADGQLKLLLQETLERNRAFVAGMAFGVPAEAALQYVDAIVDDLVAVIKPLIYDDGSNGLEYARIYGVYPDGRPYIVENPDSKNP